MNKLQTVFFSSIVCFIITMQVNVSRATDITARGAGRAVTCATILPVDARHVDSFKLCSLNHSGKNELYACQNFISRDGHFRVYFKGGRFARAMARITGKGDVEALRWFDSSRETASQQKRPACDAEPPGPVPETAHFIGAGVCEDESGEPVPCSVFRNKAPRLKFISDHMVLYTGAGMSQLKTWSTHVAINHDAVLAEMVYQIGLSLVHTRCCQDKGLKYIEQAINLFPGATLYQKTYRNILQQVADSGKDQLSYYVNESN